MNQIYLKLLNRLYFNSKQTKESNQGFVLPTLIGLGLIMTLVGLTLIGRSSTDQQTATSQKQASQAQAVAETGVTEVMQKLNQIRALTDNDIIANNDGDEFDDADGWEEEYKEFAAACATSYDNSDIKKYVDSSWIQINNNQHRFRVLDYSYTATDPSNVNSQGTGILQVEGQANFNQNSSTSVVEINLTSDIKQSSVPGLFTKSANFENNNKVSGDVLINDCDLSSTNTSNIENGEARANPFAKFPDLPNLPADNDDADSDPQYRELNDIGQNDLSNNQTNTLDYESDEESDNEIVFPIDASNDPYTTDSNGNKVYHYLIRSNNQGESIDLVGGSQILQIDPTTKVRFYLEGNINLGGNSALNHDCTGISGCRPSDFHIYGGDGNNTTYNIDGDDEKITDEICISGDSTVDAFILAPEANAAVDGGGDNGGDGIDDNAGFTGTLWVKSWYSSDSNCGSSTSKTLITQNANWSELDTIVRPRTMTPAQEWQRKGANAN